MTPISPKARAGWWYLMRRVPARALDDFRRTVDDMIPVAKKLMFPNGLLPGWRH